MNQFILLIVMTFNTPNGAAIQTVQFGPYYDYNTCKEIGEVTAGNVTAQFHSDANTTKSKEFSAAYSCVQKNDIPAQFKKKK